MGEKENVNLEPSTWCRFGEKTEAKVDKMVGSILELDRRTSSLEKNDDRLEHLYDKTIEAIEKSANTFVEVQVTMVRIQEEIKALTKSSEETTEETKELKQDVAELKRNFNDAEELGKVDIRKILKDKSTWFVSGGFLTILLFGCGVLFNIAINLSDIINFFANLIKPYIH